ncbi:hypothetical protein GCM10022221_26770 [Actinocorallia aurea]
MAVWDELEALLRARDRRKAVQVTERVLGLDDRGRREAASALPGFLRSLRLDSWGGDCRAGALKTAGAGCLGGAAATAAWLTRRDLRQWDDGAAEVSASVLKVLARRPRAWRLDLAARLAARLRFGEITAWGDRTTWDIVAGLLREEAEAPPTGDAFVAGWLLWRENSRAADDPFFATLAPALFEVDGMGPLLTEKAPVPEPGTGEGERALNLAEELVGGLDRAFLLDACVRRFLRGGDTRGLAWFVRLHERLAPTAEESAARVRDYVRLLPTAVPSVAAAAFAQVRAVDAAEPLAPAIVAEVGHAMLFRPERKFLTETLGWLDRTARGRAGTVVALAAAAFAVDHADTRERAVRLAVKYAPAADPLTAEAVRGAAAELTGPLRAKIVAAYGGAAEPVAAQTPVLHPVAPRELDPPIDSPAELVAELSSYLHAFREEPWQEHERLLQGLVVHGPAARGALAEWKRPWALEDRYAEHLPHLHIVVCLLLADRAEPVRRRLVERAEQRDEPAPAKLLRLRCLEAAGHFGEPALLATPTEPTGHVDPEVFAARLRLLEEAGAEPGEHDLAQALLRLPRGISEGAMPAGSGSPAAAAARSWIASGGFADPCLEYAVVRLPREVSPWAPPPRVAEAARLSVVGECRSEVAWAGLLASFTGSEVKKRILGRPTQRWASVLPSHRELVAAHLLAQAPAWPEWRHGQGDTVLALADATGPTGRATAAVLLLALASSHAADRAAALDALLSFAAQDALPASDMGDLLAELTLSADIVLSRVVKSLAEAQRAGAHLWPLYAAALPRILPETGPTPPGLGPLLALAADTAEHHGIRTPIPELTPWTATPRTSRTAKEAHRLHKTLTTP